MYQEDPDPWSFATSEYEQRRYDLTVASLLRPRYRRAFEPGCAIGELTRRLATRCDHVVALEPSPTALARGTPALRSTSATSRSSPASSRETGRKGCSTSWCSASSATTSRCRSCSQLRDGAVARLEPGGTLVAVHWRGHSDAHRLHGDEVHAHLAKATGVRHTGSYVDDGFRLDLWERT